MSGNLLLEPSRALSQQIIEAVEKAGRFLLSRQKPDGHWCAELEADTTLESDQIKLMVLLDRVDPARRDRLVRTILKHQTPNGGWPIYAGGPEEINASVKAYTALRLSGWMTDSPVLMRARGAILRLGGLERINSFEKTYLALLGAYPWEEVPALPPELVLLPTWFPFNIYEIAYWSRTILVPLAVVYATRPMAKPAYRITLEELWVDPRKKRARITNLQKGGAFWRAFFLFANALLKRHERFNWKPFRAKALKAAEDWILPRLEGTDGLGAIYPAMLNNVFALKGLGCTDGNPVFEEAVRELERLELPDGDSLKVQPCFSPVWDTGISLYVLGKVWEAFPNLSPEIGPRLEKSAGWLKANEIRMRGDWAVKNPGAEPSGWAFEYRNPFYPDVDDSAQVLLGFHALYGPEVHRRTEGAFRRGLDWIVSMQNRDGGWSSFDKNNDCQPLTHFPFADHNAMLDPSAADITGRILELLAAAQVSRSHEAVKRALAFLRNAQEPDGTWFGRWGVNYVYGSWLALRGLKAIGEPMASLQYQRAGRWLISRQNPDGGWGESCRSYDDPSVKGKGPSTASQTAWALMSLMSLGMVAEPAFRRGVEYLLRSQGEDGNWPEGPFTGTGFPRVFYLKYHYYRTYFPLLALVEAYQQFKMGSDPILEKGI